jgi:hypothetical protein
MHGVNNVKEILSSIYIRNPTSPVPVYMVTKIPENEKFLGVNLFLVVNNHRCFEFSYCVHKIKPLVALGSFETSVTVCSLQSAIYQMNSILSSSTVRSS